MVGVVANLIAVLIIHGSARHGVGVSPRPLSLLFSLAKVIRVHESVANSPLGRAVAVAVVADVLYEEIMTMPWNVATQREEAVEEKVFADAETSGYGKGREQEA